MVVALSGLERCVLHYSGPRYEHSPADFPNDLRPLAAELVDQSGRDGNVDFAKDGVGQKFDVLITMVSGSTSSSMTRMAPVRNWSVSQTGARFETN
jgi:hypothetical protein